MKKIIAIAMLVICCHAITAQVIYKPITKLKEVAEISGTWTLGATRPTGYTPNCKDYTVKFYDAPWSFSAHEIMRFTGDFLLSSKSDAMIRLANGKKGQKFNVQIIASAAGSGTLMFSNHKQEALGNVKLSGNNISAPISFVYESTGENGKEYLKLTCADYWNLEKITISSIKN